MTVLRASNAPVGLNKGKSIRASGGATSWVRNPDWAARPSISSGDSKIVGVVAVYPIGQELSLLATVSSGTYSVDWGDGTTTTGIASNTKATKVYSFSSLSSTTTSFGYKTAAVTVTPSVAGALTGIDLQQISSTFTEVVESGWLDVAMAGASLSSITINAEIPIVGMSMLERVDILSSSKTSFNSQFYGCSGLRSVSIGPTVAINDTIFMFKNCTSLQSVSLFNTGSVTDMSGMFSFCSSLQTVPLFDTSAVTDMSYMFDTCTSLQTVPLFNTSSVTSMSSMFQNCTSLQTVPLFNTSSVISMDSMFPGCSSLQTVPLFNTGSVIGMNSMFQNCTSLQTVPLFNTELVIDMSSMFNNCTSLQTVPLFNTSLVEDMTNMFSGCISLQTVPALNCGALLSAARMTGMFSNCPALRNAPLSGTRYSISYANCSLSATELNSVYTGLAKLNPNITNVTSNGTTVTYTIDDRRAFYPSRTVTITGVNPTAYNLTNATVQTVTAGAGNTGTFTVTNAATGAYVSGGVATITNSRTITVTGNYGTTGDTTSIATNKGWTVTG